MTRTCQVHGCELISAIVPIRYGYPDMDERWNLEGENPNHGQYVLGGCMVSPDSPRRRTSWLCPVCMENYRAVETPVEHIY